MCLAFFFFSLLYGFFAILAIRVLGLLLVLIEGVFFFRFPVLLD
uniref:Uncharacterized protein n=1 Tax=Brassica oleracea TaxID=3712 RepID=A0A3P6CM37_BRAOL|nr:unnamed protein product [Brassica oleracea]